MKGLTNRQRQVLQLVVDSLEKNGYPPTLREIGEAMGIRSTNGVSDHVKCLVRKGYLQRRDRASRTIRPTSKALVVLGRVAEVCRDAFAPAAQGAERGEIARSDDRDLVEVPILGRVAAGAPILATEDFGDRVHIDRALLPGNHEVFGLRVLGDSMVGDGILDGDMVFVRKQSTATHGAIVVALIEKEATVKRYYPEGDRVRFQPSNPAMEPIYVHRNDFVESMLIGKVVGVFRRL